MNKKILCIDDELNILQGYKRALRGKFELVTASGGREALEIIQAEGPFAVIVSDMRMPEMDGVQVLAAAKQIAPDSIRVMLTGNVDQQTAADAVNKGNIFRFLTKPCAPEFLLQTLNTGVEQYGLVTAEKELLEGTLNKSLQVLVDVLALVNSTAFSRSPRVKRMARDVAIRLGIEKYWEVEIAAMLSHIGCVAVPDEILAKVSKGTLLTEEELNLFQRHPETARKLISQIPRLGRVAEMIAKQNRRIDGTDGADGDEGIVLGSRVLKVVLDYDNLIQAGNLPDVVIRELNNRDGWYDKAVLKALEELLAERVEEFTDREVLISELQAGMVLQEPLFSKTGTLLLSLGQEITLSLILKLSSLQEAHTISETVKVRVPVFKEVTQLLDNSQDPETI